MNAVEAVVKAYGAGKVELESPQPSGQDADKPHQICSAPSFVMGLRPGEQPQFPYTAVGAAKYLGWTGTDEGRVKAAERVLTALAALELIERGVLLQ